MRLFLVLILCSFSFDLLAQTGIGTSTPDASAKLEIAATNKGFLPPRVQLTASNVASPITNPANGLMVFNTVTAGSSPNQVVPGYYYWDGNGQKWVSLSTTVGNVQNQAIFRSTSTTAALNAVSSWSSSFNNIASSDLTITSNTSFTLSNGFYKLEWALPYQSSGTYNDMLLQENISNSWGTFRNSDIYARVANGGGSDWGGGTFAADVVDCTSSSRTFRLYSADGNSRILYAGATFIITKLNPAITTSTTADNLGNHIATNNIQLNGNYLSNDGTNKGIRIDNSGNIGIGTATPNSTLTVGNGTGTISGEITSNPQAATNEGGQLTIKKSLSGGTVDWTIDHYGTSASDARFRIFGGTNETSGIIIKETGNIGMGTTSPATPLHIENGNSWGTGNPGSTTTPSIYVYNNNASSSTAGATITIRTNGNNGGNPFYSMDVNGKYGYSWGLDNANTQFVINSSWDFNSTNTNKQLIMNKTGQSRVIIPSSGANYASDWPSGWGGSLSVYDISCAGIYYNTLTQRSDRRLKNSIFSLEDSVLKNYFKLRPVTYYWNQDKPRDTKLQYGLIAQEVEDVFPEMVSTATDSMQTKSINYQALHALSLKAIQVLNEKLENQSKILASQEQAITILKKEIELLKKKNKKKNK